jgi:hypothetical protein
MRAVVKQLMQFARGEDFFAVASRRFSSRGRMVPSNRKISSMDANGLPISFGQEGILLAVSQEGTPLDATGLSVLSTSAPCGGSRRSLAVAVSFLQRTKESDQPRIDKWVLYGILGTF